MRKPGVDHEVYENVKRMGVEPNKSAQKQMNTSWIMLWACGTRW
jgi:hypothetical protein